MASVRQKKGIRAISSPTASAVPHPVPIDARPTVPVASKEPVRVNVVQSARMRPGKRSPGAAVVSSSHGSSNSSSPTHLTSGALTRPASGAYGSGHPRSGAGGLEKSLRDIVRHTLLSDVVRMDGGGGGGSGSDAWRVMVLDSRATRIMSSVVGMYDIMEGQVTVVEDLYKVRQPFPEMEGVYVVAPSVESIEAIKRDFRSPSECLYSKVHLFFLQPVPRDLMNSLKQCSQLVSRIKTFKEINMDYLVPETQSYHLDMGTLSGAGEMDAMGHFRELYLGRGQGRALSSMAQRLVTLCATLGEFPHVRYAANGGGRAEGLARTFQASMQEFVGSTPSWTFRGQDSRASDGGRATLLLLDRADDPLSPLMHEFTYQCLVQDLLDIKDDCVSYMSETGRGKAKKEVLLNDSDSLWAEFRHEHIAKVLSDLGNRFRELVASNAGAAALVKGNGRNMSIEEMSRATRDLPDFQELSKKMSQHVRLSQECMDKLDSKMLLQVGALQQTMTLGTDEVGKTRSTRELLEGWVIEGSDRQPGLLDILKSSKSPEDVKARLIGVFKITQHKATEEERRQVTSAANLSPALVKTLEGLDALISLGAGAGRRDEGSSGLGGGLGGDASSGKKGGGASKFLKSLGLGTSRSGEETHQYTHMRYSTPLKVTLNKALADELSIEAFPSLLPMPPQAAARKGVGRSIRKGTGAQEGGGAGGGAGGGTYSGARVIIFVIGGVCYSEMRAAYEAMHANAREVMVGGSTFLSPTGFLQALQALQGYMP